MNIYYLIFHNGGSALIWKDSDKKISIKMRFTRIRSITQKFPLSQQATIKNNQIFDSSYTCDEFTNLTPKIISYVGRKLHNQQFNPLCLIKQKIAEHFNKKFKKNNGNPLFAIFDDLSPIVTVEQNFDSLLIPEDHISRSKSECYYINRDYLLRAHMTAHQFDIIKMGLDNFILFGDVYRRDEIDSTHFPVFHQLDGVMLIDRHQLAELNGSKIEIFESKDNNESREKQLHHTLVASTIVEGQLKSTLSELIKDIINCNIKYRWVEAYFPFTHPSWELEIYFKEKWIEILGCGIVKHSILEKAGAADKIGWAFGMGLERLAMILYEIPDIRIFWSKDSGFLNQFKDKSPRDVIKYKPVSVFPQCSNDISFWLPENRTFESKDFLDLVRDIGGEMIEQVHLVDDFTHPKSRRRSLCYRITYRHLERTLTQTEVNQVHKLIEEKAVADFGIVVR